jgi:hypothetical protein
MAGQSTSQSSESTVPSTLPRATSCDRNPIQLDLNRADPKTQNSRRQVSLTPAEFRR